jgi:hypothetical protein
MTKITKITELISCPNNKTWEIKINNIQVNQACNNNKMPQSKDKKVKMYSSQR